MNLCFDRLKSLLGVHPRVRHFVIAYSGGVDSHVLLHLLATHRSTLEERLLSAVYVDHGLQPTSGEWGRHCQRVCWELRVDFSSLQVDARPQPGESPEAAARRARYKAFQDLLEEDQALLTAHHRDDQAETVLLQLLRGSGPPGLAAMPVSAPLGRGRLLRPLLETERTEILAYAEHHGLAWIEDGSNTNRDLDRNFLRHEILPLLKRRWPAAARTMARSASLCAETAALVDTLAQEELAKVAGTRPDCLDISALCGLDPSRQRNVLRHWLRDLDLPVPNAAHLRHILCDAIAVPGDRQSCIRWPGGEVRRYRDQLFAMPSLSAHDAAQVISWPVGATGRSPLYIPGIGRLSLRADVVGAIGRSGATGRSPLRADLLADGELTVRFRRGGERFRPHGRRHSQALKKLLQDTAIPPWERDRIPLLYRNQELIAVAGVAIGADFAASSGEDGLVLEWQREPLFGIL